MMPPFTTIPAQPSHLSLSFLALIEDSEIDAIRSLLHQFPDPVEQMECCASKADLRGFIRWALQQSYSTALTADEKLQLLDMSWKVQQLLWAAF